MNKFIVLAIVCLIGAASASCPLPTCPSDDPTGAVYFADQDDCSSFYECSNGKPYHFTCPGDLKFNPKLNVCDYPQNVECPKGCSVTCPADGSLSVYFPDPQSCSGFYQCSNGVPFHFDCPADLHFNPQLNVCDWPQNVNCNM